MSLIRFGYRVNMNSAQNPVTGSFIVGYDLDGILKQKDSNGVITPISSGSGTTSTLGKIKLIDLDEQVFTDLIAAIEFVQQFTTATLTDTSFSNNTFYFTVPRGTQFDQAEGFLGEITNSEFLSIYDEDGLITFFENESFNGNERDQVLGNYVIFKDNAFREATGNIILGNGIQVQGIDFCVATTGSVTIGDYCIFAGGNEFTNSSAIIKIGKFCEFYEYSFQNTTKKVSIGAGVSFFDNAFDGCPSDNDFQDVYNAPPVFLFGSSGNNVFYGEVSTGNTILEESTGNNIFYKRLSLLVGSRLGYRSQSNNTFYGDVAGANADDCFAESSGINKFYGEISMRDNFGYLAGGKFVFYKDTLFGNSAFNASACETYISSGNFGDNCFKLANPVTKNSIVNLATCGTGFAKDYTGRFDILGTLGLDELDTLPSDIFDTANLCSIHYPNALEYADAGAKDGDLLNIISNASNPDNLFVID